jgi:HAD superfamily hydrolase (TIGR01509 family)
MILKAVIWDNDGVLVDTERLYFEASKRILATVGYVLTKEAFVQTSMTAGQSLFDLADVSPDVHAALKDQRNALYSELLTGRDLTIDGARDTLEALKGRVRMMIVTSSRRDHFEIIHQSTGLLSYFESVVDNSDFEQSKPYPEPYLMGLKRLGLTADDCIVVEDSARGMTSAIRAGLRCVVVPNALTKDVDFDGAYRVVDKVGDVVGIVEEMIEAGK